MIEWYGMTEVASSPIACNPLPPRQRKAGSVGCRLVWMSRSWTNEGLCCPAVRPARSSSGAQASRRATMATRKRPQAAFAGDWFKTGDLGYFDDDGYLFLAGRIREMINRGGEKVAPQEVDEVLLDHQAVAEAVTFAVPHATLGEDVAAAVVLRPHAAATPKDIRQFATGRIADFKVPRQVLIVSGNPKRPDRQSAAYRLGG